MVTYVQMLVGFVNESSTEMIGRWVRRVEDADRARIGDWFPTGVDHPYDKRLVVYVAPDIEADSQWVALEPVRKAHDAELQVTGFLSALWSVGWVELERLPVEGASTRL